MSSKYNIFFIGAGKLAWHLAPAIEKAGHKVPGLYSRSTDKAFSVANKLYEAIPTSSKDLRDIPADFFFLTVSDDAIKGIIEEFIFPEDAVVVHCSGTASLDLLKPLKNRKGCFYPVQTFSGNVPLDFSTIPIVIEAGDTETEKELTEIATSLTGKVFFLNSDRRKFLHLAAVFANNFTNHLIGIAGEILKEHDIDPVILKSLVQETVRKATENDPFEIQTGPAKRGDDATINKHLEILNRNPDLWEIYEVITNSIRKR